MVQESKRSLGFVISGKQGNANYSQDANDATTTHKHNNKNDDDMQATTSTTRQTTPPGLYGDFFGFWMMLICMAFIIRPAYLAEIAKADVVVTPRRLLEMHGLMAVYAWNAMFSAAAWWHGSASSSAAAAAGFVLMMVLQNVHAFPPMESMAIVPHFLWLLLVFSCNGGVLSLRQKLVQGVMACVAMVGAAFYSPSLTAEQRNWSVFPTFALSLAAYVALHVLYAHSSSLAVYSRIGRPCLKHQDLSMHGARAILVLYFAYFIVKELNSLVRDPSYATEGGFAIVQATTAAALSLVALGAFKQTKTLNATLQTRVRAQQEELLLVSHALRASGTAVAVTSADRRILWSNPAAQAMAQRSEEALLGETLDHALRLQDEEGTNAATIASSLDKLTRSFDVAQSHQVELELPRLPLRNGPAQKRVLRVDVSPFVPSELDDDYQQGDDTARDKKAGGVRFVVVLNDISEHLAREKAEKAAQEEATRVKTITASMETLTHELRTPLQGVMGITSMLIMDQRLPEDVTESLNLVSASSGLLLVLINNLLDVRKLNANMMEKFPLVAIAPSGPIRDATDFCRPFASISTVHVQVEPPTTNKTEDVMVLSNDLRLQQVMINLISNAIKHTPAGTTIHINSTVHTWQDVKGMMSAALACGDRTVAEQDDQRRFLVVSVKDSGGGIAPSQSNKLFGRFSMLMGRTREREFVGQPTGSGLGLNLCHNFLRLMNGNIWARNNSPEDGCTFSFCLPLAIDEANLKRKPGSSGMVAAPATTPAVKLTTKPTSYQYRVLLVDDTLINRRVFLKMLQRIGVVNAKAVESGMAALQALNAEKYDLVISDIQMPGMSGIELSRAIQTAPLEKLPVVVGLTADTSERVEEECKASGMLDVLHKPITLDEMRNYFETEVGRLLRQLEV